MKPTAEHIERMGKFLEGVDQIYRANGCPRCLQTGFAGRRAVFELLVVNDDIRETIMRNPTPGEIMKHLADTKFTKLLQSGYQLVAEGVTTIDEIERVVGG
jgi:type II secretory ATPase GspE/PulE/Tfp pilus assembly ATPase PilB-like protein